jgi:hypothetical protein
MFEKLGWYFFTIMLGLLIQGCIILPILYFMLTRQQPCRLALLYIPVPVMHDYAFLYGHGYETRVKYFHKWLKLWFHTVLESHLFCKGMAQIRRLHYPELILMSGTGP